MQVAELFWDDHRNAWMAAYEFLKIRMPVPMTHLRPARKGKPPGP